MSSQLFAGIDPGLAGAVGLIDDSGEFVAVHDTPVLLTTTGRKALDAHALAEILRQHGPVFALVERVGPRPGEGAAGGFSFGFSFGAILGVLGALGLPHALIQPAVWKRRAGIPPRSDKRASILAAKRILPGAAQHLARVKDDGRAEALLLAIQARQRWIGRENE